MSLPYDNLHLIADPLYGYLQITLSHSGEVSEADIIDSPWVQRLKRIHQLQSSWWVFPSAEHSRFTHSLGTMHLAGRLACQVYPSLVEVEPQTPSLPLVEETLRLAGLLHDLGHGPFSHFCDEEYFLPQFGLDHEQISQYLIRNELADLLAQVRRSPSGMFAAGEAIDARHVAFLVRAEDGSSADAIPRWVRLLHRALSGAVTVDNLDYVRRDAFMCGVSLGSVDVDRLIYYAFCTAEGITYHKRALSTVRAFLNARFYMYENVYFHRVGHAIDLHLHEIFSATMKYVLPEGPLNDLVAYRRLSEWSLFTTVEEWLDEPAGSERRELAEEWQAIIHRRVKYSMVYEHHVERLRPLPAARDLTSEEFRAGVAERLPAELKDVAFVVGIASQDPRPLNPLAGPKRIAIYDPATGSIEEQLLSGILEFVPAKAHLYRVFALNHDHERELALAARESLEGVNEQRLLNL